MSLCRLCSSIQALELRPVRVRCAILPRGGGYRVQCVAEAGGRSYATRRRTNRSSRSEDDDDEEDGEKVRGGRGYWDSNAEGVRRSRGRQQGWNRVDGGRNPGWEPAPGWSMPKEWDYVAEEREKRSSESSSQQRWQSSDYDEYEYDEEDEEDEDDSDFDLRSVCWKL